MSAFDVTLTLHNILRWIVLIAGVLAAGRAIIGWRTDAEWTQLDDRLGLLFTISFDIQVLLGIVMYLFLSPTTTGAFSDFGAAMGNSEVRFYLVEHSVVMLLALGLAHAGRAAAKGAHATSTRHRRAAIFFTISLILILALTPWGRPLLRLGNETVALFSIVG